MKAKDFLSRSNKKKKLSPALTDSKKQNKLAALQGDYGFLDIKDMPTSKYKYNTIQLTNHNWATTGEFSDIGSNHCGAIASTNLALYFAYQGYDNLLKDDNKEKTFLEIHKLIGNGPVMKIAKKTQDYFKSRGYDLGYSRANSYKGIKMQLKRIGLVVFYYLLQFLTGIG